ncbi:hypothetical protein J3E73DRAFT_376163 [Bipolaris maydis]|nr:hypothetical protein J3E73DRAFT_376163 [Bipolaris maydis]
MKLNAYVPLVAFAAVTAAERFPVNLPKHVRPRQYSAPPSYSPVGPSSSSGGGGASSSFPSGSSTSLSTGVSSTVDLPSVQTSSFPPNATTPGPSTVVITSVVVITSYLNFYGRYWKQLGSKQIFLYQRPAFHRPPIIPALAITLGPTTLHMDRQHLTGNSTLTSSSPWSTGIVSTSSIPPLTSAASSSPSAFTSSPPYPSNGTLTETSTGSVATRSGNRDHIRGAHFVRALQAPWKPNQQSLHCDRLPSSRRQPPTFQQSAGSHSHLGGPSATPSSPSSATSKYTKSTSSRRRTTTNQTPF